MIVLPHKEGNFIIRTYQDGDKEQILSLFQEVFQLKKDSSLWDWEFLYNPYGTQIMLCEHSEEGIIAQCAALPCPLFFQDKIYLGAQLVDCMCKKEYRSYVIKKRGLFSLTVQHFFDVFTGEGKDIYLYGFPGIRHFKLGKILLNYKKIRPLLEVHLTSLQRKLFFLSLQDFKTDFHNFTNKIYELALTDARFLRFCIFKDPKYLAWRYFNSIKEYNVVAVKNLIGHIKAIGIIVIGSKFIKLIDFIGAKYFMTFINLLWQEFKKPISIWFPEESFIHKELKDIKTHISSPAIQIIPSGRSFWSKLDWDWANKNFHYFWGDSDLI